MILAILFVLFYWMFSAIGSQESFTEKVAGQTAVDILDHIGKNQRAALAKHREGSDGQALPGTVITTVTWEETEKGLLLMLKTPIAMDKAHPNVSVTLTEPMFIERLDDLLEFDTRHLRFLPSVREEIKKQAGALIRHKLKYPYLFNKEPKGAR